MKRVIHVPIVHGQADLGPIQERVKEAYIKKGGEAAWKASRQAVAQFWNDIEEVMNHLPLDYSKLRLYQDGLPVCGQEERIVRDLAQQGGANHRILLNLIGRGARIEGTEDPDLLREEYKLIMEGVSGGERNGYRPTNTADNAAVLQDLLERRDAFIAQRIANTLQEGETGLLFLGALHHAIERLPEAITVISLSDFLRASMNKAGDQPA